VNVEPGMNRRTFLTALIGTPALAAIIAACGDDSVQGTDTQPGLAFEVPTAPDAVVMRIGYEGGYVAQGTNFIHMPTLLISGAGRVFTPGATTLQYPGSLLPAIFERSITPAGIQQLVTQADAAGLLGAIPDYSLPEGVMIADASDTVVTITVNGATYEHRANALGFDTPDGGPSTPARDNLQKFVEAMADLPTAAGAANVGVDAPFQATSYRFQAMAVDPTQWTDPAPTVVPWPADTGVVLADSTENGNVRADKVAALFESATQLTFFEENGVVYQLAVIASLPGDPTF
jgi:hypothetical protein